MKKTASARILISSAQTAADLRYLCGAEPPEKAVFIQSGRERKLIVSEMEFSRMRRSVRRGITVLYPRQSGAAQKKDGLDLWIKKAAGGKKLIVNASFPLGLAEKLRRAGCQVTVSAKPVCPQRETKTPAETAAVQTAQRAAAAAMTAAVRQIAAAQPGRGGILRCGKNVLTAEFVRATIHRTLFDMDCTAGDTIVACGALSADPHERGSGPLYAGRPVIIDIFPRHASGYWGDLTRTVCRGPAPAELKKMYRAVQAAQACALQALKAGAWTDDVHAAAAGELDRRGFETGDDSGAPQGFVHGTGHGVGLEIHEAPRISAAAHIQLKSGHIVTVEPGLYYHGIGGVRIEDTVLVTRTGCKILARCPKKLEI